MIEFVGDLPPKAARTSNRRGPRPNPVVEALKTRPGEWARVREFQGPTAGSAGTRLREQGCETATRKIDGRHWLFARWPENGTVPC